MSSDDAIRATNDDAAACKRFAIQQGYWKDPYLQYFVRSAERKQPDINRGYYVRTQSVKILLKNFLKLTNCNCQVVSFGAGFDTMFWVLQDEGLVPKNYTEMDFQGVTSRKCYYIKRTKPLLEKINTEDGEISCNNYDLHAANYHIVSADMRHLQEVEKKLHEAGIDKSLPTFFLAECVLVYIETEKTNAILKWIADNFKSAFFVNYEQCNMSDRFGQVMLENLRSRDCVLHGVDACHTLDTQKNRFLVNGFTTADVFSMSDVYNMLPQSDIQRMEKIEFLDDKEILRQLFDHYCLCWAYKDDLSVGLGSISLVPE